MKLWYKWGHMFMPPNDIYLCFRPSNSFRRYRDTDPIHFHMFIDRDHQALSSIDDPCFHQIGGFRIDFTTTSGVSMLNFLSLRYS